MRISRVFWGLPQNPTVRGPPNSPPPRSVSGSEIRQNPQFSKKTENRDFGARAPIGRSRVELPYQSVLGRDFAEFAQTGFLPVCTNSAIWDPRARPKIRAPRIPEILRMLRSHIHAFLRIRAKCGEVYLFVSALPGYLWKLKILKFFHKKISPENKIIKIIKKKFLKL